MSNSSESTIEEAKIVGASVTGVPKISVVSGPSVGRAFAMSGQMATIGRHPTNDLVVDDRRVSGVHLELSRDPSDGNRVRIRDAGSTNGTWLGAHRISEIALSSGGELAIGDSRLRLDIDPNLSPETVSAHDSFGNLLGTSALMRSLFGTLERISPKDVGVLIQGETGTGKEEVARSIHIRSARATKPFVVVDAVGLPEGLADTVLFGVEGDGSNPPRIGMLERASGGTLFIDEVGELSPSLQAKFLRVMERQEIVRIGAAMPTRINVRVISATHHDLRHEIEARRFREDLYYRLAPVRVLVPPLRDRSEDIPALSRRLLHELGAGRGEEIAIDEDAITYLCTQPWPGNVRQLKNALVRASALAIDGTIRRSDLAVEGHGAPRASSETQALDLSGEFSPAKDRAIGQFELAYLAALMKRCKGNLSAGARESGVARHHLRDLLKKRGLYGVDWSALRDDE